MSDHGSSTVIYLVWKWYHFPLAMENLTVINFVYFSGCSIGRECVIAKSIVTESATLCPRAYSGRCVCIPGCVHHQKFIPQGYLKYEGRCSYCKCFPDGRVSLSIISPIIFFNFLYLTRRMKENEFDKTFKWLLSMKESVFGHSLDIYTCIS